METIYVNLDARRVTGWDGQVDRRVCVGQETVLCSVPPRRKEPVRPGKVLDFEACRRSLEGAPEEVPAPAEERPPRKRPDLVLAADIAASVGVLLLVAAVAVRFFLGI